MCRIASLFFLQRLKGSMSGDARDFNNIETCTVIKAFYFLQDKAPKEIHAILTEILGEHASLYATVKNWVVQYKRGDFSTCDAPCPVIKTPSSSLIIFQRAKLSTLSITHLCWCSWRTFWRKNAGCGKATKGVLFLHDNAPAHRALTTHKKLAYLGFQCLDHPPYSPDLAPSDYHLFPGLKKQLKVRHFSSDAEVIAAAET